MKKIFASFMITIILCTSFTVPSFAATKLGDAIYTDIVTYINHVAIQSFCFDGKTLIVAEDLVNFGFNVKWNEYKRTLTITRDKTRNTINVPYVTCPTKDQLGKKEFTVTTTDVGVYTGDYKYSSYGGIDGYTLIDVTDLACIDDLSIVWVPEVRALKIWIGDGLESYYAMVRPIPKFAEYYEFSDAPDFSYQWNWLPTDTDFFLNLCMITDDGTYINDNYGTLVITDVIDADGNSILKKSVSVKGTSLAPYVYNLSDHYLSLMVMLTADDLHPQTANEPGGIIKFSYKRFGTQEKLSQSIRVDQLPYNK